MGGRTSSRSSEEQAHRFIEFLIRHKIFLYIVGAAMIVGVTIMACWETLFAELRGQAAEGNHDATVRQPINAAPIDFDVERHPRPCGGCASHKEWIN